MKVSEIRSTSTSSEAKGESLEDTVRTFSSYTDLLIMRHFEEGFAEKTAWLLNKTKRPVPVINGGPEKTSTQHRRCLTFIH
jgi:aspartate carbamoyltransferase catalytic subunit